jgi:hypothetical protein
MPHLKLVYLREGERGSLDAVTDDLADAFALLAARVPRGSHLESLQDLDSSPLAAIARRTQSREEGDALPL